MNRIAVFPGSFDPFTIGHKEIIDKVFPIFDKIIIACLLYTSPSPRD